MHRPFTSLLATFCLALAPAAVLAQAMPGMSDVPLPGRSAIDDPNAVPPEGGWDALARLLEAAKPGVDTSIPPTPSQITDNIEALLNQGRTDEALQAIEERLEQEKDRHAPGTDVQLQFQHARALAAAGRGAEAEKIYLDMTTRYPELPEPWNNLAALYVQRGELDLAYQALQSALMSNPRYGAALANLADVRLMLAARDYRAAAREGVQGAAARADAVDALVEQALQ